MFFSIVVPVYNVEKYLTECIESILDQTFSDFELILVDDGAKDNSPKICDIYAEKDNRVKVIHKFNGGLSDARNVGTEVASGEYLIYIDSDDYIADNKFLECVYQSAIDENAEVICYKFKKYYEDKKVFSKCNFFCPNIKKYKTLAERLGYMVGMDAFYCSAWSKCIRLSVIKKNNIKFEKGLLGEDQEWYYHVLCNISRISYIDEAFIVYRQRSNSITTTWGMKNLEDCLYIVRKWAAKIPICDIDEESKIALLGSIAKLYCNLLVAYTRFDNEDKKRYYEDLKKLRGLMKYDANPRVKKFYSVYRIGGFGMLMLMLKIICKVK